MRALTYVQKRVAEVRARRQALLEGAMAHYTRKDRDGVREAFAEPSARSAVSLERGLLRGEIEPEVIILEDGTVRLAPLEWASVASDVGEQ